MPSMIRPIKIVGIKVIGTRRSEGSENIPNPGITFDLCLKGDSQQYRVMSFSAQDIGETILQLPEGGVAVDLFPREKPEDLPETQDRALIFIEFRTKITSVLRLMLSKNNIDQIRTLLNELGQLPHPAI
jgi:hypothetical protein